MLKAFRKASFVLSFFTTLIFAVSSFAYTYITINSVSGLVLAAFMTVASFFITAMIMYNTSMEKNTKRRPIAEEEIKRLITMGKIFLAFAIPCGLLSAASNFIGAFASLSLIGAALAFPPTLVMALSIVAAIIITAAIYTFSIIQTYESWQRITLKPDNAEGSSETAIILDNRHHAYGSASDSTTSAPILSLTPAANSQLTVSAIVVPRLNSSLSGAPSS